MLMPKHTTKPESPRSASKNDGSRKCVLVIRLGRLGDTVMATPIIEPLRQTFGTDVLIDFAVSPGASESILNMDQRIRRVYPIAHRRTPWRIHAMKRALEKHSRKAPYDLVINLECGAESDDFVKFVHTLQFHGRPLIQPRHSPDRHCIDTEKSIYAGILGAEAMTAAGPLLQLKPGSKAPSFGFEQDYVVINPGFSGIQRRDYRAHRAWPIEHWLKLIRLMTQQFKLAIVINGTQEERPFFDSLLEMPAVHSLFGSSLPTLLRTLEGARCLISVDTGTMHLATALGLPVIALFGPSNSELTGPYSRNSPYRVLTSGIDCQPCYDTPLQKQCTFNRCMQTLSPESVYRAFEELDLDWSGHKSQII
jgi:ADP-heptose:LPS heptosyltransferase